MQYIDRKFFPTDWLFTQADKYIIESVWGKSIDRPYFSFIASLIQALYTYVKHIKYALEKLDGGGK